MSDMHPAFSDLLVEYQPKPPVLVIAKQLKAEEKGCGVGD